MKNCRVAPLILILLLAALSSPGIAQTDKYIQVPGLIDLRTDFSDGSHTLEFIIQLAKKRGFDVLFVTDHDRKVLEYGIRPFQHILKKRVETPSINKTGPENYLSTIQSVADKYPEMILIPGAESSPFYYWKGSYLRKNLTVCDWEKHLIIIGLDNPKDFKELPVLHNGFSTRYISSRMTVGFFLIFIPLAAGIFLTAKKGILRWTGIVLSLISLLLLINNHPFKSSPYDQYHESQGILPYQLMIDFVNSRGGMAFWNHPETKSGKGKIDFVFKDTPPHPQVLTESKNYSGFAALYGDSITVTEPGNLWDKVLLEYCSGLRKSPAWGISSTDFHQEGAAGEKLGNFPTVFLVERKTKEGILDALRNGRLYACRGDVALPRLVLEDFSITDSENSQRAVLGEEILLKGKAKINIRISTSSPEKGNVATVRLIKEGKLLKTFSGETPLTFTYLDEYSQSEKKTYYRLDVKDKKERIIVSNPIFVHYSDSNSR
ncbi:MAG: hypothetical protein JSV46_06045 [Candidatus Aminicenantes bacterium]|nr:MAG: hypothetical protein JSV46_06045 [Candidatus Aminicenantes bacterium]